MDRIGKIRPRWLGRIVLVVWAAGFMALRIMQSHLDPRIWGAMLVAGVVAFPIAIHIGRSDFRASSVDNVGHVSMQANLTFAAMPFEWQRLILPALDKHAQKLGAFKVNVEAVDGWLMIRRAWNPSRSYQPLEARYPLAAVTGVVVERSVTALAGSSLTFQLGSGKDVRFDVPANLLLAETVAKPFRDAANAARSLDPRSSPALEITTTS